jgi:2-amino-4-hydroxy-6-hydroxymethyldihydropteridine diphosphokinase
MRCFIGLGSNLGEAGKNLNKALEELKRDSKITLIKVSSFYETEPMGVKDQAKFINAVCEIDTTYTLHELFRFLKNTELEMGRKKAVRYGPRVIDLDILFFGGLVYQDANITVPHPRIKGRSFVLHPMEEIAPDFLHPFTGESVYLIKSNLKDDLEIKKLPSI